MTYAQEQIAAIDRVIVKRRSRGAQDSDIRQMLQEMLGRRPRVVVREHLEKLLKGL